MHSTIEKVLFLKSIDLFAEIPGEVLGHVAQIAQVELRDAKEIIVREGDVGDYLYIVTDGVVSVRAGAQEVARLGERECFGEMSLLDSEPRSATIVAVTDVGLLRIGQEDFYELLSERVEIARGVIRVLTRRLRDSNKRSETSTIG